MIVVTGATGTVGREVVRGLLERGTSVRALVRDPATARLPREVELVAGDLTDPKGMTHHLNGAEAVFLVWPFLTSDGASEAVKVISEQVPRVVYLSAEAAARRPESFWAQVEEVVRTLAVEWTFLRPTGFAANTRLWSDQIRRSDVVEWVYGQAARSLIDERDIAAVAVRALTGDGHGRARYVLTGPQALTQVEQVEAIGAALGREIRWHEITPSQLEDRLDNLPSSALQTWAGFVEEPEIVTSTVQDVTGRPARPFAQWARDHADDFR
ncbi:MAG TPA: NAD(P)H-binding protein [Marmoricola sp.]|jgi:uncharacterized protein YbjT (DUF2867 family)|nr:NAD(P)H-binding protein [Marmoricola sp.]